ncbi:uncharacterized protein LOC118506525 [Anopheles stephensi]|uniref:uncharacterized protein LOC118506525 n=1 Tax=Anopheles stephensi TaxID=30069 RepID=UPI001658B27E|nr:uncharacterized protein LOC118506525 [Anopheles stephensi]
MFRRIRTYLERAARSFERRLHAQRIRYDPVPPVAEPETPMEEPMEVSQEQSEPAGADQPSGQAFTLLVNSSESETEIFFQDEPLLYYMLLMWNPETPVPLLVKQTLDRLNYDYENGHPQSRLHIFYRIFLNRQLSDGRALRPRFLTAKRRATINKRRKQRLAVGTYV